MPPAKSTGEHRPARYSQPQGPGPTIPRAKKAARMMGAHPRRKMVRTGNWTIACPAMRDAAGGRFRWRLSKAPSRSRMPKPKPLPPHPAGNPSCHPPYTVYVFIMFYFCSHFKHDYAIRATRHRMAAVTVNRDLIDGFSMTRPARSSRAGRLQVHAVINGRHSFSPRGGSGQDVRTSASRRDLRLRQGHLAVHAVGQCVVVGGDERSQAGFTH